MKYFLTIFLGSLLISCGNSPKDETAKNDQIFSLKTDTLLPADLTYKILSEIPNDSISKCNIDIELNHKISVKDLTNLANNLRSTRTRYNKLWMFYTLPNMKAGSGAWATTHFTPELQVEILGATSEQEINSNKISDNIDGKQIGKWYEQQSTSATYLFYEKDNNFFMKTTFKDGTSMETKVNKKEVSIGLKLTDPEDTNGEYYIISKSGDLEFYNKENKKFATGQAIQ